MSFYIITYTHTNKEHGILHRNVLNIVNMINLVNVKF